MLTRRSLLHAGGLPALAAFSIRVPVNAAEFEFRCGSDIPAEYPSSVRLKQMFAAIERESRGRIRVQYFPSSQLGGNAAMFSQLRLGALPLLLMNPGNLAAVVPVADISLVGFAFKDQNEACAVMDGPLGNYVRGEIVTKQIHPMRMMWDGAMYQVGSNSHPISVPADLRGFKVRLQESRITVDLFRGLGASPAAISFSELYSSLQTRLVDGEAASLVSIETNKFFEVNKYVSITNHAWSGLWLVANMDVWNRLPSDLQEIVERNNTKYATLVRRDTEIFDRSLTDKLARQGLALNRVDQSAFRAGLRPYFQSWATTFGSMPWGLLEDALGRKLT